jgi:predicted GH43/DUF377 family glycosyl hydrolase
MDFEEEQPVAVGDDTPKIQDQAKSHGWACDIFNFGKAEQQGTDLFNPGLVRRPDGLWLLVRRSEAMSGMPYGMNKIVAFKLDQDRKPTVGVPLNFPDSKDSEQFEDPRGVFWNNQTWIGVVNFEWFPNGSWTGAHQAIGIFQDQSNDSMVEQEKWLSSWRPIGRRDPIVGTNKGAAGHTDGRHNKNLTYFFLHDKLHCVYTSDPWLVVEFGNKWEEQVHHVGEGPKWKYGLIRGGTPPVLVGDKFYTFFHSSLPWRGRYRRYYMGALAFEATPPFKPVLWTQEPLLIGSQNDFWHQQKPLVVFPCGAVMENGKWLVTFGVNDLKSAWIEIPHEDLQKMLDPIPAVPGISLLSDQTVRPVYEPIPSEDLSGSTERLAGAKPDSQRRHAGMVGAAQPDLNKSESSDSPAQSLPKPRGRPRKDGLPPGSVQKPKRKRRRRKKKALKLGE